ncbi:MAG TPA: GDSL-type esterase/lipase family protein [Polyangiaceae bacterium]
MWRAEGEPSFALVISAAAALIAATCSRESRLEPSHPARPNQAAASAAPVRPVPSSEPAPSAAPRAAALPEGLALPEFYAALAGLEGKSRREHARVLWLGDSHTAADYMTGAFRRRLQVRFGAGGPGFLRIGASPYRHGGVKFVRDGRWRVEPEPPSRRSSEGDTAFGYGGLRVIPLETRSRAEARLDRGAAGGTLRYELLFDLPPAASFRVSVGSQHIQVDKKTPLEQVAGSPIAHLRFQGAPGDAIELASFANAPRLYGLVAEGSDPGVVLDTSGIDGARFATALAWNAEVLAAELAARRPELVVLAYGTNEAFDNRRAEASGNDVSELVARIRRGVPRADCLIVGPPDAAAPDFTSLPRVAEIEAVLDRTAARLGCGFFSLRAAMGGEGGFTRWMKETPALARGDRVHLSPSGYERLGEALADAVTSAYDRRKKP